VILRGILPPCERAARRTRTAERLAVSPPSLRRLRLTQLRPADVSCKTRRRGLCCDRPGSAFSPALDRAFRASRLRRFRLSIVPVVTWRGWCRNGSAGLWLLTQIWADPKRFLTRWKRTHKRKATTRPADAQFTWQLSRASITFIIAHMDAVDVRLLRGGVFYNVKL